MKKLFLLFVVVAGPLLLRAQTNAELLEQAVRTYNAMRDFEDNLKPGTVKEADVERMKADIASGRPKLETVMRNGTTEEATCARYFNANFSYELGFIYGMMGRNKDAYEVLNSIATDYNYFSTSDRFPLGYKYDGKNYSIKYENFAPTLTEYYTGMAEITANLSKYDESLIWARKSLASPNTTAWYKYISYNKVMEVKGKQKILDQELLDAALNQMLTYADLDTSYKRTVKENNYPTQRTSFEKMKNVLNTKPELGRGGYYYATAAPVLERLKDVVRASEAYSLALDAGYSEYRFYDKAIAYARDNSEKEVGLKACAMKETKIGSTECGEWIELGKAWAEFGNASKATEAKNKGEQCEADRKRREAEEEAARRRRERRENRAFGIYAGIYPGPLLTRFSHYRDFGGVAGITLSKSLAVEGSFKLIKQNHVLMEDLSFKSVSTSGYSLKWDGMKAHVAFKIHPSRADDGFYVGPLFGYVNRKMHTWSAFSNPATSYNYAEQPFDMEETSYELLANYGMMMIKNHFMLDMFMGVGASYYKFNVTTAGFDNDTYAYVHPLLENRSETRIGPMVRMGMTIGLGTHKRYWTY
jgi:hypothetical protein